MIFALAMICCLLFLKVIRELFLPILIVFGIGYALVRIHEANELQAKQHTTTEIVR